VSENTFPAVKLKRQAERKATAYPRYSMLHIELTICELTQIPSPDPKDDKEAEYSYSAKTRDVSTFHPSKEREITIGWCEFSVAKEVGEKPKAEITATYLFVYMHPQPSRPNKWEKRDVTEAVISASVWPRFRDLVAHMVAQGSTVFPPLPFEPDKIAHTSQKSGSEG